MSERGEGIGEAESIIYAEKGAPTMVMLLTLSS